MSTSPGGAGLARVLLVDDHPLWRDSVARLLAEHGCEIVAALAEGARVQAVALATRPDVALVDLQLPDLPGVEVVRALQTLPEPPRVLVLSASGERADVLEAVKAGASGYLLKSAGAQELVDAVAATARGDAVFTPGLAGLVLGEFRRMSTEPAPETPPEPASGLTERETEVLRLVAKGLGSKQIGERLGVSHRTVQHHVQNVLGKLHLHNRVQLTRYALDVGLADPDTGT